MPFEINWSKNHYPLKEPTPRFLYGTTKKSCHVKKDTRTFFIFWLYLPLATNTTSEYARFPFGRCSFKMISLDLVIVALGGQLNIFEIIPKWIHKMWYTWWQLGCARSTLVRIKIRGFSQRYLKFGLRPTNGIRASWTSRTASQRRRFFCMARKPFFPKKKNTRNIN